MKRQAVTDRDARDAEADDIDQVRAEVLHAVAETQAAVADSLADDIDAFANALAADRAATAEEFKAAKAAVDAKRSQLEAYRGSMAESRQKLIDDGFKKGNERKAMITVHGAAEVARRRDESAEYVAETIAVRTEYWHVGYDVIQSHMPPAPDAPQPVEAEQAEEGAAWWNPFGMLVDSMNATFDRADQIRDLQEQWGYDMATPGSQVTVGDMQKLKTLAYANGVGGVGFFMLHGSG